MHNLSDMEMLVAALHGSTYKRGFDFDDEHDREHPLQWLHGVALWIGDLKRKRHRMLNEGMAHCVLAIEDAKLNGSEDVFLAQSVALLVDRLSTEGWDALVNASNQLLDSDMKEPVHVVYEWASNPERPRWAEQRDDAIVIGGPLLDFPTYAAAEWNRKARIVWEERGLILRHKRDDVGRIVERKR